ncbi:ribosomal RNA processing protein 1 homolog B isoform X1 [Mastacembelus armatus]|uniref:Ribosomal RNA processing 1 n=1 Tax=Mastacembelus armatus TaxID=205130 RepID=A0A3Q3LB89_9TELE|nr:ribosomal RNA processing protein 1 homolog B isoform X1 [Mastacembelus armatus]
MAATQELEVQFAQRLASNEKPIRTKAIKKLRKYINARSQKATGGFTSDELLKLWKGLFYCLWMQDKPLLQEQLSKQISTLIHSFHSIDGQFLYLESFLQTFKREWTGIDRLRMDKFFQLVRFMFRQTFEMLKRKNWEDSVVARFLELLTTQLLQNVSAAPSGLQFHILDLYMTELATVGSAELTASQNLVFIEPFCKTAVKTKDRSLFGAICNSIFSAIVDQAPFAIEDLIKEVKAAEDLDSWQASEECEDSELKEEEEEDEHLHLEDSGTELSCDDIGPVLQFDYAALADKLFELASRSSTPSHNRQRLYKIIKVLRDLSQGVFPQDQYPEDVSTDEDDEMFGSRKKMKRVRANVEEETPAAKKSKGKKTETSTCNEQKKDLGKDDGDQADPTTNDAQRKKKKKKKPAWGQNAGGEENTEKSEQGQTVALTPSTIKETKGDPKCSQIGALEKKAQMKSVALSVKVTEAAAPHSWSKALFPSEEKKLPLVGVKEAVASLRKPCATDKDQSETLSKKKIVMDTCEHKPEVTKTVKEQRTAEPEMSPEAYATFSGKKKRKSLKAELQRNAIKALSEVSAAVESTTASCKVLEGTGPETGSLTPAKKNAEREWGKGGQTHVNDLSSEAYVISTHYEDSAENGTTIGLEKPNYAKTPVKKSKKNSLKSDEAQRVEIEERQSNAEITSEALQHTIANPLKKMTKGKGQQKVMMIEEKAQTPEDTTLETSAAAVESTLTPLKKKTRKNQKEPKIRMEEEQVVVKIPQVMDAEKLLLKSTMIPPAKKKKKTTKLAPNQNNKSLNEKHLQVVHSVDNIGLDESDVGCSSRKLTKKKRKIPVVFEFEADELETTLQEAAYVNGFADNKIITKKTKLGNDPAEPSTPLSTKKTPKKTKIVSGLESDFITFQGNAAVPAPLFCKAEGNTPLSSKKKKTQTPKSESKKVTFGLKNNKTAEFRKTDRSLLVSPDGSSRVPFDPMQKPKFGVLKSPPLSTSLKKIPNLNMSSNTPKSTARRRPSSADFF